MFIPTWLLIVIAVVIVSLFWPAIWDALKRIVLVGYILLLLVSIPASLYFFSQGDTQTAWVASLPCIALVIWGLWLTTVEGARSSLWLHELRVGAASSPEQVEQLRRNYAKAINLAAKMWQLREDVKYFPSWYSMTNADGTTWTSNVVGKNEIAEIKEDADVRAAGLDPSVVKIKNPYVLYTFSVQNKPYAFCTRDGVEAYGFDHDADGEALAACGVWVIEKPSRIVLALRLAHYWGEYADTLSCENSYVEAFKPAGWLPTLLGIAERVHQDEREKHERWKRQWGRERAEKNFS